MGRLLDFLDLGGEFEPTEGGGRPTRRDPAELAREQLGRKSGLTPEQTNIFPELTALNVSRTEAEVEAQRKKKNFFTKFILGGSGAVGKFEIPGTGIQLINPIKAFVSGLEWSQYHIVDPIAGHGIGIGSNLSISLGVGNSKIRRVADLYAGTIRDEGLFGGLQAAGNSNRSRHSQCF